MGDTKYRYASQVASLKAHAEDWFFITSFEETLPVEILPSTGT